jgi:hypothetical protein
VDRFSFPDRLRVSGSLGTRETAKSGRRCGSEHLSANCLSCLVNVALLKEVSATFHFCDALMSPFPLAESGRPADLNPLISHDESALLSRREMLGLLAAMPAGLWLTTAAVAAPDSLVMHKGWVLRATDIARLGLT